MNYENDSRNILLDETKVTHSVAGTENTEINYLIEEYERLNDQYPGETLE
jgi:hypothetical protein